MTNFQKNLYGSCPKLVRKQGICTSFDVACQNGYGKMDVWDILPGVELFFISFESESAYENVNPIADVIEINYCRKGRFECEFHNNTSGFLGEGDLAANMYDNILKCSGFPLGQYEGVGFLIDLKEAAEELKKEYPTFYFDLFSLKKHLCPENQCFITHASKEVAEICESFYDAPKGLEKEYYRLKTLELLMRLTVCETTPVQAGYYLPKTQVQKLKSIRNDLIQDLSCHVTIKELADKYNMSLTTLKTCFKGIYQTSPAAYLKEYRLQTAANLLCETEQSITKIAASIGYENPSKFSSAFKARFSMLPTQYRVLKSSEQPGFLL